MYVALLANDCSSLILISQTIEDLGEEDLYDMLDNNTKRPFVEINLEQNKVDDLYQNGQFSEDAILARYNDYLLARAQSAAKLYMVESAATTLLQRYEGRISVIPTCASSYHQLLDPNCAKDPAFGVKMSGMPLLRQTLLSMIADQKLQIYKNHYFETLPSIIDTIQRIRNKTSDKNGVLISYRASFQQYFENAMRSSREAKRSRMPSMILPIFTASEKMSVTKRIESTINAWSNSRIVYWPTFQHTLRYRGIPISLDSKAYRDRDSVNWNRDLLETMERPAKTNTISDSYPSPEEYILHWKRKLIDQIPKIVKSVVEPISELGNMVNKTIERSDAAPALKKLTLDGWKQVEVGIHRLIERFTKKCGAAIENLYRLITTEEDIGCIIAKMNQLPYNHADNQLRGLGAYDRLRQSLLDSLCDTKLDGETFVDRYEKVAMQMLKAKLASVTERFITEVETKLTDFITVTEASKETEVYKTSEHIAAREVLCKWLPDFQDQLFECQQKFPKNHDQQEVQFIASTKRSNITELESPVKRMKTE